MGCRVTIQKKYVAVGCTSPSTISPCTRLFPRGHQWRRTRVEVLASRKGGGVASFVMLADGRTSEEVCRGSRERRVWRPDDPEMGGEGEGSGEGKGEGKV